MYTVRIVDKHTGHIYSSCNYCDARRRPIVTLRDAVEVGEILRDRFRDTTADYPYIRTEILKTQTRVVASF